MKEIKKYLETRIGEYSFHFEHINSGFTYSINEKDIMPSASCIKVPIAIALMKCVENKLLSLEEKVLVRKDEMTGGSGFLSRLDEKEYSMKELLVAMLSISDNTAANKIMDIIGFHKINEIIKEMGLDNTYLKRRMMDLEARERGLENLTTSFDYAQCFKLLYMNKILNNENSKYVLDILRAVNERNKIPFYIPEREWCNIANKPGDLSGIENDGALITISKGNFIFTIMSKNLPNNVYGIVTISRAGKMMWDSIIRDW